MLPPDDVSPSERLEAGQGKSDRWRISRVTEGVNLSSHARRLSAIGTSRRLDESGPLLELLPGTRSLGSGTPPTPFPRTPQRGTAHPAAVSSSPTAPWENTEGEKLKCGKLKTETEIERADPPSRGFDAART